MIGPESVISILAVTLLGTGALLSRLPIGTCAMSHSMPSDAAMRWWAHALARLSGSG